MKILSAEQIRQADAYTIAHEPISSVALMDRAAHACVQWILTTLEQCEYFYIFCGPGNNGGDGLAIASMLHDHKKEVYCFGVRNKQYSKDYRIQEKRVLAANIPLQYISKTTDFPSIPPNAILIDSLFGTGLSRSIEGIYQQLIDKINQHKNDCIAIDIPSGLFADKHSANHHSIIEANYCLSFQQTKLAFLMPENEKYCGQWHILPIGLHPTFINECPSSHFLIDKQQVKKHYKIRGKFSHKGKFGHSCIIAGSYGMTGAAVLAGRACLKAGTGLLSYIVPESSYTIVQQSVPEAMVLPAKGDKYISDMLQVSDYTYGIGPGLGRANETAKALLDFLRKLKKPAVLDADALNIISDEKALSFIPKGSILTPHPKEFQRLFGHSSNDFERLTKLRSAAKKLQCTIILKGAHTAVATPKGEIYFNTTGNPGMASGGSGDVLTGLLTALMAQQYQSEIAAIVGVYIHGKAADIAWQEGESHESITATDLINRLGTAFRELY